MTMIPEFKLPSTSSEISTNDLVGSPSILVFYPKDGTDVCSAQLAVYNQALPIFEKYDAKIYGISTDNLKTHKKFAKTLNLKFPLLSDNNPDGAVSKSMGVYDDKTKRSKRALFVLDKQGNITWKQIYPDEINPGAEGILKALEDLKSDE